MRPRRFMLLQIAVLLLAPALASTGEGGKAKVYKTPQEVFDAAKQAVTQQTWKELCDCLTEDSRRALAGMVVLFGSHMENAAMSGIPAKDKADKKAVPKFIEDLLRPLMKVYTKHGITKDYLKGWEKKAQIVVGGKAKSDGLRKMLLKAAQPVKQLTAFITEFMWAFQHLMETFGVEDAVGPLDDLLPKGARLEDLKVEGDSATGRVMGKRQGVNGREPIQFKKVEGGWKIELPFEPAFPEGGGLKWTSKEPGARTNAPAVFRCAVLSLRPPV